MNRGQKERRETSARARTLSWLGFGCAVVSGLFAILGIQYARAIGGFPLYDPRLLRIYATGILLSIIALTFGSMGASRGSPRWLGLLAPVSSVLMLLFWLLQAVRE